MTTPETIARETETAPRGIIIHPVIDWEPIHRAAEAVDQARRLPGARPLGDDGIADAFGGSYRRGGERLADLVELVRGAQQIRRAAWEMVHAAAAQARAAAVLRDADGGPAEWWAVGAWDRPDVRCVSRRGANYRAARYGGRAEARDSRHAAARRQECADARVAVVVDRARRAVATALALHELLALLAGTGIYRYHPDAEICGVGRYIQLTGLRWLVGQPSEKTPVPTSAARAFVAHGLSALALEVAS